MVVVQYPSEGTAGVDVDWKETWPVHQDSKIKSPVSCGLYGSMNAENREN